ncbi:MAG: aminopeptidase [Gammaproteobacteria bacterium RIFCSPHIGHO2_12_FULL_63_22]|nr:MAG: aminopeptidase [Gammaproteobacteria bacterium RIFCSPHIGHO2_12_FULL_63_22]
MRLSSLFLALVVLPLAACQKPAPTEAAKPAEHNKTVHEEPMISSHDVNSYAEPEKVVIKHLALDLGVDFDKKVLSGSATLDLDWKDPDARSVALDTRDLDIAKIEGFDGSTWQDLKFEVAPKDPIFGSKLSIAVPSQLQQVRITYSSRPEASGLQWLTPAMTMGKKTPFMFSQSQAIHARSWVPLQDTPGVRFTYEAHITTPKDVMALMSADNDPKAPRDGDYSFKMPQAIPSYLMAIAAGDLVFAPISERAGVWAEPAMAPKAAKEFESTEKMIVTAERLYGAYRWGRYDILVLPPSFPFGGMENPRLTFATPTVIVGDQSLVSIIAHELAHSWSGNLVTNSSWKDIWLNEGFTSYVENRIVEDLFGKDQALMENVISQDGLKADMKDIAPADQVLTLPPLVNRDPDEGLTQVAYIKGQWFLMFLEERYGRETFDAFLRKWFDEHAFTSLDSSAFERFMEKELFSKNPGKTTHDEIHAWMHGSGIPAFAVAAKSTRFDAVDELRGHWLAGHAKPANMDTSKWTTQEWVRFIEGMPETLSQEQLAELDAAYKFTGTQNGEIAQRWYPLTVRSGYTTARPAIADFLSRIGRRKLIMPTYAALAQTPDGLAFAQGVFEKARPGYHPITTGSVEQTLAEGKAKR